MTIPKLTIDTKFKGYYGTKGKNNDLPQNNYNTGNIYKQSASPLDLQYFMNLSPIDFNLNKDGNNAYHYSENNNRLANLQREHIRSFSQLSASSSNKQQEQNKKDQIIPKQTKGSRLFSSGPASALISAFKQSIWGSSSFNKHNMHDSTGNSLDSPIIEFCETPTVLKKTTINDENLSEEIENSKRFSKNSPSSSHVEVIIEQDEEEVVDNDKQIRNVFDKSIDEATTTTTSAAASSSNFISEISPVLPVMNLPGFSNSPLITTTFTEPQKQEHTNMAAFIDHVFEQDKERTNKKTLNKGRKNRKIKPYETADNNNNLKVSSSCADENSSTLANDQSLQVVKPHICDFEGCNMAFERAHNLKTHKITQ